MGLAHRPGRQQRTHLGAARRVVEDEQHPTVGDQGPPRRGAFLHAVGDRRQWHAGAPEQHQQGVRGGQWVPAAGAEVDEELPVREGRAYPVGRVHRERIYAAHSLSERLSVVGAEHGGAGGGALLAVNLYRHRAQPRFAPRELDAVLGFLPPSDASGPAT